MQINLSKRPTSLYNKLQAKKSIVLIFFASKLIMLYLVQFNVFYVNLSQRSISWASWRVECNEHAQMILVLWKTMLASCDISMWYGNKKTYALNAEMIRYIRDRNDSDLKHWKIIKTSDFFFFFLWRDVHVVANDEQNLCLKAASLRIHSSEKPN